MSALSFLSQEEHTVFAGLLYKVVCADGKFSRQEAETIVKIAGQLATPKGASNSTSEPLSAERLFQLINDSAGRVEDSAWLDKALKQVKRHEAREVMYSLLRELANSDAIVDAEWDVLDRVAHMWQLEVNSKGELLK